MALEVWWIGKKEGYPQIDDYLKRLKRYSSISVHKLKDSNKSIDLERKAEEAEMVMSRLKAEDYLVLLDETGKSLTTKKWANRLNDLWSRKKRTVFLIGGAYGVDESIKARANESIRLSDLTLPHEMARLLLIEQIYRGFTILNGEKYHHS